MEGLDFKIYDIYLMEIDKIHIHQEEEIDVDYASKGVRLDVYAKNSTQAFNVEMQSTDTKELAERARYYQGVIDVDCLKSGQHYKDLKDSYVIFICIDDIFEKGLAKYSFENLCIDDPSIKLNDRTRNLICKAKNCFRNFLDALLLNKARQRAYTLFYRKKL